jgi:hypothetical protein
MMIPANDMLYHSPSQHNFTALYHFLSDEYAVQISNASVGQDLKPPECTAVLPAPARLHKTKHDVKYKATLRQHADMEIHNEAMKALPVPYHSGNARMTPLHLLATSLCASTPRRQTILWFENCPLPLHHDVPSGQRASGPLLSHPENMCPNHSPHRCRSANPRRLKPPVQRPQNRA